MKHMRAAVLAAGLLVTGGCKDFLDVNNNPNAPETAAANLYLPPMIHWMTTSPQFDGRFIGQYTQQWVASSTALTTWQQMGYDRTSDNGAQQFRDVYWSIGKNLNDMMAKAEAEQRWDLLGIGYVIKAWGWQVLTDMHGEIIVKQAYEPNRFAFDYDEQQFVYEEVRRLLREAIKNLQRTDGAVDAAFIGNRDRFYQGDRAKWLKMANGILAMNYNHYTKKSSYLPDSVIAAVDRSLASNADDALLAYPASSNDDTNFWGRTRNNLTNYRQTRFVVDLMNGTNFGGTVDPRMSRMLSPSPDGVYRGLDVNVVGGGLTAAQLPNNFYGYPGTGGLAQQSRYIFDDKSRVPFMTYAQLQFVKAEAALRKGDRNMALTAYRNGVNAHFDFVNARNLDANQSPSQITAAERAAYLANPAVNPTSAANLTLQMIMVQKYIAQWAWGHNELWMDMRRYDYTGLDPQTGAQVYPGFAPPSVLFVDNAGKVAQRTRMRYNSEYVWNIPALEKIGGLSPDFHTKPLWITQP